MYKEVNEDVLRIITKTGPGYYIILALVSITALILYFLPWIDQIYTGQGVTGLNVPAFWGIYLVDFVFWIGVAHAGTLISAMLYITETPWRRGIARSSETMTLIALMLATLFIIIHMGRPWNFYWLFPYPNQRKIWTNFLSPLMFDVFAIGTYFTSSLIFLYFGMIPDLASLRHNATGWRKRLYASLSFGWCGTDREWHLQDRTCIFFSAFIIPLVVSVHSIVSWDFAFSIVPGYRKTIFAPYFVTGALFSGFASVILLISMLRQIFPVIKKYITEIHYDRVGIMLLVSSLLWSYLTSLEIITTLYGNRSVEIEDLRYKVLTPPFSYLFVLMISSNAILPLTLIIKKVRSSPVSMSIISAFILAGMWLERYIIVSNSLSRRYLPWMWHLYSPSWVEVSITIGSFFIFVSLFMIFVKIFPIISIYEVKEDVGVPMERKG